MVSKNKTKCIILWSDGHNSFGELLVSAVICGWSPCQRQVLTMVAEMPGFETPNKIYIKAYMYKILPCWHSILKYILLLLHDTNTVSLGLHLFCHTSV